MKTKHIAALLAAALLPGCNTFEAFGQYGSQIRERIEVSPGLTTVDGWTYGPLRFRVRADPMVDAEWAPDQTSGK